MITKKSLTIMFFVFGLSVNTTGIRNINERLQANSVHWAGCLIYYGENFYFYPNIQSSQIPMILSNSSKFKGFNLMFVCGSFLKRPDLDYFFETVETQNNNPKLSNWNRIHYTDIELKFEFKDWNIDEQSWDQVVRINDSIVHLKFIGTIRNAKINVIKEKGNNKNTLFIEDTKFFRPGVLSPNPDC